MKIPRIINSLLETDMYKFSMGQAIYHQFPSYTTKWNFKCRNSDVVFSHEMIEEIRAQIKEYCNLRFSEDELNYLSNIRWIKDSYINFLRIWHPRFEDFLIEEIPDGCHLKIQTEGTWLNTSMYEIAILAIVNEVYFRMQYDYNELFAKFKEHANEKVQALISGEIQLGVFSEFGERRRLSAEAQEYIVKLLAENSNKFVNSKFIGTSNVYLARKCGVIPVGTMAHEFIQCVGQGNHRINPAYSNYFTMQSWIKEYGIDNGIALTDCIGTDVFLRDFDRTFATLFNGVRHDSGDPILWGEKILSHLETLGINPHTKTLLFSDSLNFKKANDIYQYFKDKANIAFGIGTYLANDTCVPPLNIVCKVIECNGYPVAKLSDCEGKGMCLDENYVNYLKRTINWRLTKTKD